MLHRLFTVFAMLTLALSIVFTLLWLRSYRNSQTLSVPMGDYWQIGLWSSGGGIRFQIISSTQPLPVEPWFKSYYVRNEPTYPRSGWRRQFLGFSAYSEVGVTGPSLRYAMTTPHPVPTVLTQIPFTLWMFNRRRKIRQSMKGRCAVCGYDLRATPYCCPECGTPVRHSDNNGNATPM